jgi:hypothetical protein
MKVSFVVLLFLLAFVAPVAYGSRLRSGPATEKVVDPEPEASGASGADDEIVPVQKLEKEVDAVDKKANDAAKKVRLQKEALKQAKTELAQALTEAAKASEDTHGASEQDALKPSFGKMLTGAVNETKEARDALRKVQRLQANMTLEQLDAMNMAKDDAAFREHEIARCRLNVIRLTRNLANATRAVKLQKKLTGIAQKSLQASLHRAYQANKNAQNAPHIEVDTIGHQLERSQNATRRARAFYAQLQLRAELLGGAQKLETKFKEAIANAKTECGSFEKNLKQKEANIEKPDDTAEIPGPNALKKDPTKLPGWFQKFLKKQGWKGPSEGADEEGRPIKPSPAEAVAAKEAEKKGKMVVALPTKDGKVRTLHNAQLHLEVVTEQEAKAGKAAKGRNSTAPGDEEEDDGAEDDAPTGATGNSNSEDAKAEAPAGTGAETGAETGAATGATAGGDATGAEPATGAEAEGKPGAPAQHANKMAAVEKELKEANKELLGLETNLKMPIDQTTKKEATKAAKDEQIDLAGQNIDKLEDTLKMK